MKQGVVIKYDAEMGYGFINPQSTSMNTILFFHCSDVQNDVVNVGDQVQFNIIYGTRGIQAIEVTKI